VFKLKAAPTGRRLSAKTDLQPSKPSTLRVLSEGSAAIKKVVTFEGNKDKDTRIETFGSERFRQLVLRLWNEPDTDTKRSKTSDSWIHLPNCLIRLHHELRQHLFVPSLEDEHVRHDELGNRRITLVLDQDGNDTWLNDTWQYDANSARSLEYNFTGATCFEIAPKLAHDTAEPEGEDRTAQKAVTFSVPVEPTPEERRLHELTHLPFRSWCSTCVKAKSKQSHSHATKEIQPVIQVDY